MTRAVVVGGSLAGMCAARVLGDYFDDVVIVERDRYPHGIAERPGTPQGRHVHTLLNRGREEFDRLFPGFTAALLQAGAHEIDLAYDLAFMTHLGEWRARRRTGDRNLFASRSLIEATVRRLFVQRSKVEILDHTAVTGLVVRGSGARRSLAGVCVADRDSGVRTEIAADIVVDASGRRSRAFRWLADVGIDPPEMTVVNPDSAYSTCWFDAPESSSWPSEWWWKCILVQYRPTRDTHQCFLYPIEGNRWIATLAGGGKPYPAGELEGFMDGVRRLPSPIVYEALKLARPVTPVYQFRQMSNFFRRYDRWKEPLGGFISVGDATCALNPAYGQGMSVATISAGVIERCLRRLSPKDAHLSRAIAVEQAKSLGSVWALATCADFRQPQTAGREPVLSKLFRTYYDRMFVPATRSNDVVWRHYVRTYNLTQPISTLYRPSIVGRVLWEAFRRRLGSRAARREVGLWPSPGSGARAVDRDRAHDGEAAGEQLKVGRSA